MKGGKLAGVEQCSLGHVAEDTSVDVVSEQMRVVNHGHLARVRLPS